MNGLKFRRQHPVAGFVLDFFCEEARLAVELDGGEHAERTQVAYDSKRTATLEKLGIRVLRFWNTEVLLNTEGVLERILEEALSRDGIPSGVNPPSAPSPGGRGLG